MKFHGTRFNVVEANNSASEHGGKMGGNHDKKAKAKGEDGKGQFGGSFWPEVDKIAEEWSWGSQIDSDDISEVVGDFLPRIGRMNDEAIFAEVAELS